MVEEYKLQIGEKEYTFRTDFLGLKKFKQRYDGSEQVPLTGPDGKPILDENKKPLTRDITAMEIFNRIINTPGDYDDEIKLLSCCCPDKDWDEEELMYSLNIDYPTCITLDRIAMRMASGSFTLVPKTENEKNSGTSQNQ